MTMTVTRKYRFYLPPGDPRHGTANGYGNYYCRCDDCKAAYSQFQKEAKARLRSRPIPGYVHGTTTGYRIYKCKCSDCCAAQHAAYAQHYRPSPRRGLERAKTESMHADYLSGMSVKQVAQKYGTSVSNIYGRFHRAGLKRRPPPSIAAMYMDYCTGMSVPEVAEKWSISPKSVWERFSRMGLPLRPRQGGTVQPKISGTGISFGEANGVRAAAAGKRTSDEARAALPQTTSSKHRQVLQLRIEYPSLSLAELGALCTPPMTKDAYAGHLRRALGGSS